MEMMPPAHINKTFRCGQCKWFYVGYNGVTCKQKRSVQNETQACTEFDVYRPGAIFDKIQSDKYLAGLQANLKVFKEDFLASINTEIKKYKISVDPKKIHNQYEVEADWVEIMNKFETITAYTDRLVEIKMLLYEKQDELQSLMKEAQAYVFNNYTDQVRSLKNDAERGAFYKGCLPILFKSIDGLDSLIRRVELAHANLKDSHFSLSQTHEGVRAIWQYRMMTQSTLNKQRG